MFRGIEENMLLSYTVTRSPFTQLLFLFFVFFLFLSQLMRTGMSFAQVANAQNFTYFIYSLVLNPLPTQQPTPPSLCLLI